MTFVADSVLDLIGGTPMVGLNRLTKNLSASITAKLEFLNPGGSIKDRIGLSMINQAENDGLLVRGTGESSRAVIVEPTGGNTAVALAIVAAIKGYNLILTMPETMSHGRISVLRALGAEVILTSGSAGMTGAITKAKEILRDNPDYFSPAQFENLANPKVHREQTAEEIWRAMDGRIDAIVAGVGTGGTITGLAQALKSKDSRVSAFAVEPAESAVLSGGSAGRHGIQGIGAGFLPQVFDRGSIDEVVCVTTEEAMAACRRLAREEGIIAGPSSGAAVAAALAIASRPEMAGSRIVAVLSDRGERYLEDGTYHA
jgi:cysteine synthase